MLNSCVLQLAIINSALYTAALGPLKPTFSLHATPLFAVPHQSIVLSSTPQASPSHEMPAAHATVAKPEIHIHDSHCTKCLCDGSTDALPAAPWLNGLATPLTTGIPSLSSPLPTLHVRSFFLGTFLCILCSARCTGRLCLPPCCCGCPCCPATNPPPTLEDPNCAAERAISSPG